MTRETRATLGLLAFAFFALWAGWLGAKATANIAATVHQSEDY